MLGEGGGGQGPIRSTEFGERRSCLFQPSLQNTLLIYKAQGTLRLSFSFFLFDADHF